MRTTNLISVVVVAGSAACWSVIGCSSESANPTGGRTGDTSMTGGSSGSGGTGSGGTSTGGSGGSTGGATGGTGTGTGDGGPPGGVRSD